MCCELLYFAALPLVFRRQRQVPKEAKQVQANPAKCLPAAFARPCYSMNACKSYGELDDRDASR